MAKNSDERYQTAQELADDLRCFLHDRPIKAKPPTPIQRVAKWSRRQVGIVWTALAAAVVISLVSLVATSLVAAWYGESNNQRRLAQDATLTAEREADAAQQALAAEAAARRVAYSNLYRAHMREAHQALQRGHVSRAESLLYHHLPNGQEPDYRGWEWYYLLSKLDGGSEVVGVHPSIVESVSLSPDGSKFASVSADRVRLRDTVTRKMLRELHIPYGLLCAQRTIL